MTAYYAQNVPIWYKFCSLYFGKIIFCREIIYCNTGKSAGYVFTKPYKYVRIVLYVREKNPPKNIF
jgi:hypothetical protein